MTAATMASERASFIADDVRRMNLALEREPIAELTRRIFRNALDDADEEAVIDATMRQLRAEGYRKREPRKRPAAPMIPSIEQVRAEAARFADGRDGIRAGTVYAHLLEAFGRLPINRYEWNEMWTSNRPTAKECEAVSESSSSPEPKSPEPLRGQDLLDAAVEVYRAEPTLTAREAYARLEELHGRVGQTRGSFQTLSTKARRLAGVTGNGTKEKAAKPPEPMRAEKKPAIEPPAQVEPEEEVAVSTEASGDPPHRILLELGGDRLEATRGTDGAWVISFEGVVAEDVVEQIVARMIGYVAV